MRGIFTLIAAWLFSFSAYAQCEVETSIPDLGQTGAVLEYTTNLSPADWRFTGPNGDRFFEGSPIQVPFDEPGTYSGLLAGQNACEETIRIEFQVRIFDLMGEPRIEINGGELYTNTQDVSVDLLTAGAVEYLLSNQSNCREGEWKPMADAAPWELNFRNAEGRVFAKFRTPIEETECVSDSIVHDDIAPKVELVSGPGDVSNDVNARFVFDPSDSGSGVDTMLCGLAGPASTPCANDVTFQVQEGPNTLVFQARDNAGNLSAIFLYDWLVDITKPTVEITSGPDLLSNETSARFTFQGQDSATDISGYTCQLDDSVVACDSPKNYSNLSEGDHRFAVIAEDTAGNKSDPALYEWRIDATAPVISFVRVPDEWIKEQATVIEMAVSDNSEYRVSCRLDGAAFQDCALVVPLSGLSEGSHRFEAYATDFAGNVSDTISTTWNVDSTAPVVSFTDVPDNPSSDRNVVVEFRATDAGVGVQEIRCQFDQDPVFSCVSPLEISNLSIGTHTIQVFALDGLGNTSAPISYSWETRVDPPVVSFTQIPAAETTVKDAEIKFEASSDVEVMGFECAIDAATFTACTSPVELTDLAEGAHSISVRAFDEFGQQSNTISHNWFIDSVAPQVVFTSVPGDVVETPDTEVRFAASDNGTGVALIECRVNDGDFETCTSPAEVSDMAEGPYNFYVRATDRLGNVSETIVTSWRVSLTLPTVTFLSVPPFETPMTEAEFTFVAESPLGIDRTECSLDGSAFSECVSPTVVEDLTVGTHDFSVVAYDSIGRPSETITYSWTVLKLPDVIEEEFVSPGSSGKLDVLLVMDNSMSMYQERAKRRVKENFKNFLAELKGLDWQFSMISTDAKGDKPAESGRRVAFRLDGSYVLNPDSVDPEKNLIATLIKFKGGSNTEEPIRSLIQAIQREDNKEFFRTDAALAIIVITDEDEKSTGKSKKPYNQPETLLSLMTEVFGADKTYQVNGVLWPEGDRGCETAYRRGRVVERLIRKTDGRIHSICQPNYNKGLAGFSSIAKSGSLVRELQCEPLDGIVDIDYTPEPGTRPKVELNGQRLSFLPSPPKGTVVKLKYSCAKSLDQIVSLKQLK